MYVSPLPRGVWARDRDHLELKVRSMASEQLNYPQGRCASTVLFARTSEANARQPATDSSRAPARSRMAFLIRYDKGLKQEEATERDECGTRHAKTRSLEALYGLPG